MTDTFARCEGEDPEVWYRRAHAQFAALWCDGTKMREAQRNYFTNGRTKDQLVASKIAERDFDKALNRAAQLLQVGKYALGARRPG